MRVIAGKHEEFVIAGGHIEVRSRRLGRWSAIAELDELFLLPLEVAANRRRDEQIEGSVLVKRLPDDLKSDELLIRVTVRDLHHTRVTSEPLTVTRTGLLKQEWR